MVEKLLDPLDEYLLELPAQQRILQRGREEGREEGRLIGLREAIREAIAVHFNPPAQEYRQISRQLERVTTEEALQQLHIAAIQAEDVAAFTARLAEGLAGKEGADDVGGGGASNK